MLSGAFARNQWPRGAQGSGSSDVYVFRCCGFSVASTDFSKVLKVMEFVFGAFEASDLCAEYQSARCITLEDVRQVVYSCIDVVHGRIIRQLGFVFLILKQESSSLSV